MGEGLKAGAYGEGIRNRAIVRFRGFDFDEP